MLAVLIVGLLMNAVALPLAGRRVWFLYRVISSGQPAPDRIEGVTQRTGAALKRQLVEVLGQKKLLKWSVPGAAHFFVFWAFLILATVYLEAYGSLFKLLFHGGDANLDWAIPVVGHWWILGFAQDFIAMMAFFGILTFVWIRLKNAPKELGRRSRFFGSHLSGAWITLFMIFNVIWTMYLFRGASAGLSNLPYKAGAFVSIGVGKLLDGMSHGALEAVEGVGLLLHIGVMLVFLIFVLNSKHLHIFVAPLNVMFGRSPVALGAAKPMMNAGKPITLDDFEDLDEDAKLGVGAAEDFSWKGILDFATCTECGRCQDQCPAWNTEKPLSPKLMIMALRDHTLAKAPYLLADEGKRDALLEGNVALKKEVERPLIGDTGDDWFYMPDSGAAVIDPDVLWSCVTCGACVQQCPVDIEHVDHIIDMRRYQVLVESNFPAELNGLFKGLENKGNPWNMSATARLDWAKDLPFDVKVVGQDIESLDEVEWLFWVGCAGAYEDRAKKTTRAVAELLDLAGVSFGVLGNGETCTGDSARRAGNEFLFKGLAAQNVETFKERKVKKVVSTCAHCFNTLKNEYQEFGIELEVVHHTQLLNRLVREKKLVPVASQGGSRSVTYHDPCYLGRHNQVYSPPRELLQVIPDANFIEMPRNQERSFCCGAGGARMWMEENIGTRINTTRTKEAVETGADQIAVGCPFCRVMLSDGLTEQQSKGEAREEVEVLDVAQMLLASIKGETPRAKHAVAAGKPSGTAASAPRTVDDEATRAEPDVDDKTQTKDTVTADVGPAAKAGGGKSLFDDDESGTEAEAEVAEPDKPAVEAEKSSSGSLFDLGDEDAEDKPAATAEATDRSDAPEAKVTEPEEAAAAPTDKAELGSSGSLFDLGDDDEESSPKPPEDAAAAEPAPKPAAPKAPAGSGTTSTPADTIPEGGSLFDIVAPTEEPAAAPATEATPEPAAAPAAEATPEPTDDEAAAAEPEQKPPATQAPAGSGTTSTPADTIPEGGSLFDIVAPTEEPAAAPAAEATPEPTDDTDASTEQAPPAPDEPSAVEAAPVAAAPVVAAPESTVPGTSMFDLEARQAEPESDAEPHDKAATKEQPAPAMRSLRDIKAQHAEGGTAAEEKPADPEPDADADADAKPDTEAEPAAAAEAEPKPTGSGEAHTPQTGANIDEATSLFDL